MWGVVGWVGVHRAVPRVYAADADRPVNETYTQNLGHTPDSLDLLELSDKTKRALG